jgi:hypothetical protein
MSSPGGGPDKQRLRDLLAEIARVTEPDPELPPEQRLRSAMAAYFAVAEAHAADYRALYVGPTAAEPEVRALTTGALERQSERLLALLAPGVGALPMVRFAVHGWFRFLVATCLLWLDERSVDRDALSDMCVDTLFSAVASATRAAAEEEAW